MNPVKKELASLYRRMGLKIVFDEWLDLAACGDPKFSPARWFFESGSRPEMMETEIRRAKRVCAMCPVRAECAEEGKDEEWGIWGGLTPKERKRGVQIPGTPAPGEHRPNCRRWYGCPCNPGKRQELLQLGFIRQVIAGGLVDKREVA